MLVPVLLTLYSRYYIVFFFFSSRRRHTRFDCDWSSDVCSSDLHTIGFLTYSEGCNDDVNKAIWSALGWDPQQPTLAILREYARYFIGPQFEEGDRKSVV